MRLTTLPFGAVPQFAARDKKFVEQDPSLLPFLAYPPVLESFGPAIQARRQSEALIERQLLVSVLREQYAGLAPSAPVETNLEKLLQPHTFTLVTAHQPSLFLGPLYFIYKIASAIRLAQVLGQVHPDCHFVPVFVIGGEDHDFEEINHANLFGRTIRWESGEGGATGRMSTRSIAPALAELQSILGDSEPARVLYEAVQSAYTSHERYGKATQALIHHLFERFGLLVLQMDDARLKQRFAPLIERELLEQVSEPIVQATQSQLEAFGWEPQAFVRPVNLFYLQEGGRERILLEEGLYRVHQTDLSFRREEILEELRQHPDRFSPNVVMRPLYQESILPNLAYVGGGGELAYWMERKAQFEAFGLPFPILIRRNSALWIDPGAHKKMEKLGLSVQDLLEDTDPLIKQFLQKQGSLADLQAERQDLSQLFASIAGKAGRIDPTLIGAVLAEEAKALKVLEQLEGRLLRAEKQKHDTAIQQLRNLREKLFPGNGLQERYDNFMPIYLRLGQAWLDELVENMNPLEQGLLVFTD